MNNVNVHREICGALCGLLALAADGNAQGTVTFDGPPLIPPGSARVVQSYSESGVWFAPIPGTDGFGRRGSNPPLAGWPDNGTAYVQAGLGDSLMFGLDNGAAFRLVSVELAEFSTLYAEPVSVRFIGFRTDGSSVTNDLVTDGIIDGTGPLADFQTLYFTTEFSGLVRVQVRTPGWCLDNLYVSVPEPSTGGLIILGAALLGLRFVKRRQVRHET